MNERKARIRGTSGRNDTGTMTSGGVLAHGEVVVVPVAEACRHVQAGAAEFVTAEGEVVPFGATGAPTEALVWAHDRP